MDLTRDSFICFKMLLVLILFHLLVVDCSEILQQNQDDFPDKPCGENRCVCADRGPALCYNYGGETAYIPKLPFWTSSITVKANHTISGSLPADFFTNTSLISYLDWMSLVDTQISLITKESLTPLATLTRPFDTWQLSVYSSPNLNWSSVQNMVSVRRLECLEVKKCSLGPLPAGLFEDVLTSVTDLWLEDNDIYILDLDVFVPLASAGLQTLSLSENRMSDRIQITQPLDVVNLHLNRNAMRNFPKTCNGTQSLFPRLEDLHLMFNEIVRILCAVCLPRLTTLDLTGNPFAFYDPGSFDDNKFPAVLRLIFMLPKAHYVPYLKVPYAFENSHVEEIRFDNSRLDFNDDEVIPHTSFARCPRLADLSLDESNFKHVGEGRFLLLLGHLALTKLSIRSSRITNLSRGMFSNFSDLEELNLSENRIRVLLDGTFDDLRNLKKLYISNNELTVITEGTFGVRARGHLKTLLLDKNPFVCDCRLRWFSAWLSSNTNLFWWPSQVYSCNNMPNVTVQHFHMPLQPCLLTREQNTMIAAWLSLLLITFTVIILVFGYRWHLRLLLYEAFRGRDDGVRQRRLQQNNFDYDVFVSYASEDLPWVQQHLLPQLEDRLGLKLCIHERDFIIGNNIVDNIAECVERSKKILMVFSKYFLRSHWCQFELTYCLRHVMDYDDNLIIVCVDDVVSRKMTPAMMAVLKTTTYIQWAELGEAVQSFWGRLKIALNEIVAQV